VFTAGLKSDPTSEATATAKEKATAVRWLKEPSGLAGCGSGAGPSTALRFAQDDDVFLVLEKPKPKPKSKSQLKAKAKAKPKPKPKAKPFRLPARLFPQNQPTKEPSQFLPFPFLQAHPSIGKRLRSR
jgi:hypothetical protein